MPSPEARWRSAGTNTQPRLDAGQRKRAARGSAFLGLVLLLSHLGLGCDRSGLPTPPPEPELPPWFADITSKSGLNFVHDAGPVGKYFLPQIMGSGAALLDFDGDGRLDIYLVHNGGPNSRSTNRLFHQGPDGRFTDVSAGSGLDVAGYGMGVAVGDVNNDGWPDVLLTQYGGTRLFLNNGNGTFRDLTKEAGLDNVLWGTSACWVDYDRDGWLDLVVVNYVDYDPSHLCADGGDKPDYCHPNVFPGAAPRLYRNLGTSRQPVDSSLVGRIENPPYRGVPRFADVTVTSGLGRLAGNGLGVVSADLNGDRWPDIFIANDSQPNRLWINQGDGTFKEEAVMRGVAYNGLGQVQANMGIALGDVNADGLLDLFVTHLTEETHTLWSQGPRGIFRDRTAAAGLASSRWRGTGFGTVLADFDHDGALDLALVNGRVARAKLTSPPLQEAFWSAYAERNQLFAKDGNGQFRDRSRAQEPFCAEAAIARGLACGDIDGDGAVDLLVTRVAGPACLYRNVAPKQGHWLVVRALDPALRRDAYGAEITIVSGKRRWLGWANPGSSYLCSNDPRVHFGLGSAAAVDAIEVVWPDGAEETFPGRPADQVVVLRKGEGMKRDRVPR